MPLRLWRRKDGVFSLRNLEPSRLSMRAQRNSTCWLATRSRKKSPLLQHSWKIEFTFVRKAIYTPSAEDNEFGLDSRRQRDTFNWHRLPMPSAGEGNHYLYVLQTGLEGLLFGTFSPLKIHRLLRVIGPHIVGTEEIQVSLGIVEHHFH